MLTNLDPVESSLSIHVLHIVIQNQQHKFNILFCIFQATVLSKTNQLDRKAVSYKLYM